ncbi:MAG TPA: prolyl oligopeptidase family serine peptidase [Streptosporangiaceae bacterium]|jgi:dipeptidyl-peptidase-4
MADTFPRQYARTQRFTLGVPRSFEISPDGRTVAFLRSDSGSDAVTRLWVLDTATGEERLVADPVLIAGGGAEDPAELARRERARESAQGIVRFCTDEAFRAAAFALAGRVYLAELAGPAADQRGVRELPALSPATDPRLSPSGELLAYVHDGALRALELASGADRVLAVGDGVSFGLAEFVAAEEMARLRGYWWSPDSATLLAARVDESPVQRWYISDPANPGTEPRAVRYPAAGTANADVSLFLVPVDGGPMTPVSWDTAAFPYLATVCWDGATGDGWPPLIVVQSRDQRQMRIMAVDTATGETSLVRDDTSEVWLELVPGVPARLSDGRIAWTVPDGDTRRLLVASAGELAAGTAEPVTPAGLQVRGVLSVDGDTVLVAASGSDPTQIGLWAYGQDGLAAVGGRDEPLVQAGLRAGGTTVTATRSLRQHGAVFQVLRDGAEPLSIGSNPERPLLPEPAPDLFRAGPDQLCTALLLPSWHRPGSGRLPVLMDPYGGPHGQMVQASQAMYLSPQWFAEQGFAVVIADGRGTPGRGPRFEQMVAGDLARPPLEDQVIALRAAAQRCADLDLDRVAIRGWSFGGYLAALAVLRRPDVFHAAVAGAPVTDFRLYDTHYTERYLGDPGTDPAAYDQVSLLTDAHRLARPLMIIHGLADDNVAVAHSLRLSSALLAAGRPHSVLPLTGVTHLAAHEEVAENLLLLQLDFLRRALGLASAPATASAPA